MDSIVDIIDSKIKKYPEFDYYLPLVEKANKNLRTHPDICIETCKSLLEGISKSIIERLDDTFDRSKLNELDLSPLVKVATNILKENDDQFEIDFVRRSTSLAYSLGELRNARGDISHGRATPKDVESTVDFARCVLKVTEGLILYMLTSFFRLKEGEDEVIDYEDNSDFNAYLDEFNPLEGKPLYSLALYQQYYGDYVIQLADYRYSLQEEVVA